MEFTPSYEGNLWGELSTTASLLWMRNAARGIPASLQPGTCGQTLVQYPPSGNQISPKHSERQELQGQQRNLWYFWITAREGEISVAAGVIPELMFFSLCTRGAADVFVSPSQLGN